MLLTRFVRYTRKLREDERGIALAAVMALMLVGVLLSALIITSVVGGLATTTSTRAGIQSEAAAEAGVDVSVAGLVSGNCTATFTSSVAPLYNATISYSTAANASLISGWTSGCPTTSATFIRVDSTGTASASGAVGASGDNKQSIEAIYTRPVSSATITASGPAIYDYSGAGLTGSGHLISYNSTSPSIMAESGNINCSGGAGFDGDVIDATGSVTLSGGCGVSGSLYASTGGVTVSGNTPVGGSVIAPSFNDSSSAAVGGSVYTTGSSTLSSARVTGNIVAGATTNLSSSSIGGSVWSTGVTTTGGSTTIAQNAITGGLVMNGSDTIDGTAYSTGDISGVSGGTMMGNANAATFHFGGNDLKGAGCASGATTFGANWMSISGTLKTTSVTANSTAAGKITTGSSCAQPTPPAAPATPSIPTVPSWIDFTYVPANWSGFTVATLPVGSACDWAAFTAAVTSFGGGKGIIDARNCTSPISISSYQMLTLYNDTAIISTLGFNENNAGFTSSAAHNLWLITPDTIANGKPDCPSGSSDSFSGGLSWSSNLTTMIYTPCTVNMSISNTTFIGQIFAGGTSISGASQLEYTPIGLPGYNLNTGQATTVTTVTNAWTPVSTRNIGS
jgi:hypothetical protein